MKYILAKDLPFAQKGTKVTSAVGREPSSLDSYVFLENKTIDFSQSIRLGLLGELIDDGWIEEVKPLEFYGLYSPPTRGYNGMLSVCGSLEFIKQYNEQNGLNSVVVKITEVE